MKNKQIELERWDIAKILADNFTINDEGFDESDFEWSASQLQEAGYHKQEWISVDERLPEESGKYLCYSTSGVCGVLQYSFFHKRFNAYDESDKELVESCSIDVSHWMPLPEPPKGE